MELQVFDANGLQKQRIVAVSKGGTNVTNVVKLTANTTGSPLDTLSITASGDGVTPMTLWLQFYVNNNTAGATTTVSIYDGSGGTGTTYGGVNVGQVTSGFTYSTSGFVSIPAFSGSKTFYARLLTSSGSAFAVASATQPCMMKLTWDS